jgi:hypothetical protein
MNRAQTLDLLTYCAACDQRTVGETDLAVWFDMLGPLDFDRALESARQHYRRQPDVRLKPGHIWQLCKTVTEAERLDHDLAVPCDQGVLCGRCKAVHHVTESCDVLTVRAQQFDQFRDLVASFSTIDQTQETHS